MLLYALAIPLAVVITATLSGVFGMAGGLILMGVYAAALPVAAAMVLHGATQLASNGFRAALLIRHVYGRTLAPYAAGAALAVAGFAALAITADKAVLYLVLGGIPLAVAAAGERLRLDFARGDHAFACGIVTIAAQLVAGASGPLLDMFFARGSLDRFQVIATKALTQTLGHLLKILYYGALASDAVALPAWLYPVVIACALAGTAIGKQLLDRLDEARFRQWSAALILAIAGVYTARGLYGVLV